MDESIPDASVVAASEEDPQRVPGLEGGSALASPWIEAVTDIVDGLSIVHGEATSGTKYAPCVGAECRRGGILALVAWACVVAGITMWAAIRNRRSIRLAMIRYFRTAAYGATAMGHRFAAPFKSRE